MTADANPARVQLIHSDGPSPATIRLHSWLEELVARKGSDLILVPNAPAAIRLEGAMVSIGSEPLTGEEIHDAILHALAAHECESYESSHIADSSYRIEVLVRFRINLHHERGRPAATVPALPTKVPQLADLRLPASVAGLAKLNQIGRESCRER